MNAANADICVFLPNGIWQERSFHHPEEDAKLNSTCNYHPVGFTPEYNSISLLTNVDFQKWNIMRKYT